MNREPYISVVIPLYNKQDTIKRTVDKILSQAFKNIELLVIDDGSTDESLSQLAEITDCRLRIFSKKNGGPASARNYGVRKAKGKWIYFIDADDLIEHDTLIRFVELVKKNPSVKVFVADYYIRKGNLFKKHSLFIRDGIVRSNFCSWFWETLSPCQGAVLYNKEILDKYVYPEHLRRWEDAAMFFEIMRREQIYVSKFPAFIYNLDNASASHGRKDINEDFLGHLILNSNQFWEKMSFRLLYEQAKRLYPKDVILLYGRKPFSRMDNYCYTLFTMVKWGIRLVSKVANTCMYNGRRK